VNEDAATVLYQADLTLTIENRTDEPIIVFPHEMSIVGQSITEGQGAKRRIYSSSSLPSNAGSTTAAGAWRKSILDKLPKLPDNALVIASKDSTDVRLTTSIFILKKNKQDDKVWSAIQAHQPLSIRVSLMTFPRGFDAKVKDGRMFSTFVNEQLAYRGLVLDDVIETGDIPITFPH